MLATIAGKVAYMKTPGQRIKEEREEKGWSQQRLADEITRIKRERISRAAVAQWEGGSSKSQKHENMFAAAEALGLSPRWVLDGTGAKMARDNRPDIEYSVGSQRVAMEVKETQAPYLTEHHELIRGYEASSPEVRSVMLLIARRAIFMSKKSPQAQQQATAGGGAAKFMAGHGDGAIRENGRPVKTKKDRSTGL